MQVFDIELIMFIIMHNILNIYALIAHLINYLRDTFTLYDISRIKFKYPIIKSH